jgi:hypothetical protein
MAITQKTNDQLAALAATIQSHLHPHQLDLQLQAVDWRTILAQILQAIGPQLIAILIALLTDTDQTP